MLQRGTAHDWERGVLALAMLAGMLAVLTWLWMDPAVSRDTELSPHHGLLKSYQASERSSRGGAYSFEVLGVFDANGMLRVRVDCIKLAVSCAPFRNGGQVGTLLVAHESSGGALGVEILDASGTILLQREQQIAYLREPRERRLPILWTSIGLVAFFLAIHLWLKRHRLAGSVRAAQFFRR